MQYCVVIIPRFDCFGTIKVFAFCGLQKGKLGYL